jgi:curved DNA-binding protein CbpA
MELSDYDILGITSKATFRIVKNAYYELSRIYHPDSPQIIIGMTKEERLVAFQRIQKAYENIKEKLQVVEVDLPQEEIDYEDDKFDKPIIKKNNNLSDLYNLNNSKTVSEENKKEFNAKFNTEFEKEFKQENFDNPFSLSYSEPKEIERTIPESKLILKGYNNSKNNNNIHEFGVNYVEDHSCENFHDVRHLNNSCNLSNSNSIESFKETVDNDFDKKLEELIKMREVKIEITEKELDFMNRQKRIQKDIEESKKKVTENRNKLYLN